MERLPSPISVAVLLVPTSSVASTACALGSDGLVVEVHNDPDQALCRWSAALFPDQFDELMAQVRQLAAVVGWAVPAIEVADSRGQEVVAGRVHERYASVRFLRFAER